MKLNLSGVCCYSKLNNKLIFLYIFDGDKLAYSSQNETLSIQKSSTTIVVHFLTPNNFYQVNLSHDQVSAQLIFKEIDICCKMIAGISKSAINLFIWHCSLAYLNEISVKRLSIIVTDIDIF